MRFLPRNFFLSLILSCYLPYSSDFMFNHGVVFLEVVFFFFLSISSGLSNFLAHYFFKKSHMNLCIFVESDLRHLSFLILFIWVFSCIITLHKSLPILFIFSKVIILFLFLSIGSIISISLFMALSCWFLHFFIFGVAHPFSNILSCKIRVLISDLWIFLISVFVIKAPFLEMFFFLTSFSS